MDDLEQAIATWQAAIESRDLEGAARLMHEDYALVIVHPAPATVPRGQWLDSLHDYVVHDYAVEEQRVDVVGDVAAVLSRVRMRATVFGVDRSGVFILSDTWLRAGSLGWQVWRRHSSPLSAGEMPVPRS